MQRIGAIIEMREIFKGLSLIGNGLAIKANSRLQHWNDWKSVGDESKKSLELCDLDFSMPVTASCVSRKLLYQPMLWSMIDA